MVVRARLRKDLADFLKTRRAHQTYAEFSRRIGISSSTLQRIEMMQQNVSIDTLQHIVNRLRCKMSDIFRD